MAPFLMREFRDYHEPFLGGGAVFFELSAQGFFDGDRRAHLNDALRPLMRTYRAVRANPVAVIKKLRAHRYGEAAYYRMRDRDYRAITTDVDLAVWFLYVNRCGFNGMWRVNRSGGFNVPFGRYDDPTVCNGPAILSASRALRKATLSSHDFAVAARAAKYRDLVYFDPPYLPVAETSDFTEYTEQGFSESDHVRLRDVAADLKRRGVHVIVSNSNAPLVRELYAGGFFEVHEVSARRNVNSKADRRGAVTEVLIT